MRKLSAADLIHAECVKRRAPRGMRTMSNYLKKLMLMFHSGTRVTAQDCSLNLPMKVHARNMLYSISPSRLVKRA